MRRLYLSASCGATATITVQRTPLITRAGIRTHPASLMYSCTHSEPGITCVLCVQHGRLLLHHGGGRGWSGCGDVRLSGSGRIRVSVPSES